MSDGAIRIETGIDTSGFRKDSEALKQEAIRLFMNLRKISGQVNDAFGESLPSVQRLYESFSNLDTKVNEMTFSTLNTYLESMRPQMLALIKDINKVEERINAGLAKGLDVSGEIGKIESLKTAVSVLGDRLREISGINIVGEDFANVQAYVKELQDEYNKVVEMRNQLLMVGAKEDPGAVFAFPNGVQTTWNKINEEFEELRNSLEAALVEEKEYQQNINKMGSETEGIQSATSMIAMMTAALQELGNTVGIQAVQSGVDALASEFGKMADASNKAQVKMQDEPKKTAAVMDQTTQQVVKDFDDMGEGAEHADEELRAMNPAAYVAQSALSGLGNVARLAGVGIVNAMKLAASGVQFLLSDLAKVGTYLVKGGLSLAQKEFQAIASAAARAGQVITGVLSAGIKKAASGFKSLASGVVKAASALLKFGKESRGVGDVATSVVKKLSSFKRMLLTRIKRTFISAIFGDIKEGMASLAKADKEFDSTMSNIMNSAKELSGNAVAAISNILIAIEPVITRVLDYLSEVMIYLNTFFAKLRGKDTIMVAKKSNDKYSESADKSAKSSQKATKAAKEYTKTLAGFDEITNLTTDSDKNKSGSGSADSDAGYMSLAAPMEFAKDWKELGQQLAEYLNDCLQTIDDFILSIHDKAVQIASNAADFANGFVENLDWKLLGKTIGDGINLVVDVENEFLKKFDAEKLGNGIADTLNSMFETVHWDQLGQLFANKLNFFIDILHGFVTRFKFNAAGADLGQFVTSMFDGIEWQKLADTIRIGLNGILSGIGVFLDTLEVGDDERKAVLTNAISSMLGGINWAVLVEDLAHGFTLVVDWFTSCIAAIPWPSIAEQLKTGINRIFSEDSMGGNVNLEHFTNITNNIGTGVQSIIDAFNVLLDPESGIDFAGIGTVIGEGINNIASKVNFGSLLMAIWNGFTGVANFFTAGLAQIDFVKIASDMVAGINSLISSPENGNTWATIMSNLTAGLNNIIDAFSTLVNGNGETGGIDFDGLAENLSGKINTLITDTDWGTLVGTIGTGALKIYNAFNDMIADISWTDLGTALGDGINKIFEPVTDEEGDTTGLNWTEVGKNLGDKFKSIIQGITSFIGKIDWEQIGKDFGELVTSIDWGGLVSACVSGITTAFIGFGRLLWGIIEGAFKGTSDAIENGEEDSDVDANAESAGEDIGWAILRGILKPFADLGAWVITNIFDPFINAIKSAFGISSPSTEMETQGGYIAEGLLNGIKDFFVNIGTWVKTNIFDPIWNALKSVFGLNDDETENAENDWLAIGGSILGALVSGFTSAVSNVVENVKAIFGQIWDAIKSVFGFGPKVESDEEKEAKQAGKDIMEGLRSGIEDNDYLITEAVQNASAKVLKQFRTEFGIPDGGGSAAEFESYGENIIEGISNGFTIGLARAKFNESAKNVYEAIDKEIKAACGITTNFFGGNSSASKFEYIGKCIVEGIKKGIDDNKAVMTGAAQNAAYDTYLAVKNALGIKSPSKVFAEIGKFTMLGWAEGEEDNQGAVLHAIANTARAVQEEAQDTDFNIGAETLIDGLDIALNRLDEIASVFSAIGEMMAQTGELPIPEVALGTIIPARTRISDDAYNTASEEPGYFGTANERDVRDLLRSLMLDMVDELADRPINLYLDGRQLTGAIQRVNRNNSRANGW